MAKTKRLFKSFSRLLLPVVILFVLAVIAGSIYLVYKTAQPPKTAYLVTPEKYGHLSAAAHKLRMKLGPTATELPPAVE